MADGWNKKSFRLKEKHGWKSRLGHAICEDMAKYDPVWKEALRSLTLGVEVQDPTAGPVRN